MMVSFWINVPSKTLSDILAALNNDEKVGKVVL